MARPNCGRWIPRAAWNSHPDARCSPLRLRRPGRRHRLRDGVRPGPRRRRGRDASPTGSATRCCPPAHADRGRAADRGHRGRAGLAHRLRAGPGCEAADRSSPVAAAVAGQGRRCQCGGRRPRPTQGSRRPARSVPHPDCPAALRSRTGESRPRTRSHETEAHAATASESRCPVSGTWGSTVSPNPSASGSVTSPTNTSPTWLVTTVLSRRRSADGQTCSLSALVREQLDRVMRHDAAGCPTCGGDRRGRP